MGVYFQYPCFQFLLITNTIPVTGGGMYCMFVCIFYVWFMVMYHISTSCVDLKKLYEKGKCRGPGSLTEGQPTIGLAPVSYFFL